MKTPSVFQGLFIGLLVLAAIAAIVVTAFSAANDKDLSSYKCFSDHDSHHEPQVTITVYNIVYAISTVLEIFFFFLLLSKARRSEYDDYGLFELLGAAFLVLHAMFIVIVWPVQGHIMLNFFRPSGLSDECKAGFGVLIGLVIVGFMNILFIGDALLSGSKNMQKTSNDAAPYKQSLSRREGAAQRFEKF